MTGPLLPQDDGGTKLTEEEREGLIPSYITLRNELNEAEQANILEAEVWAFARERDLLEEKFLNNLHKRMYGNVWRWAGRYRTSGKNIGIDAYRIPTELRIHDTAAIPDRPGGPLSLSSSTRRFRCLRIRSTTACSVMNAMTFISEPHDGHTSGSTS